MQQKIIHILGIAPYRSLKASMQAIAGQYPNVRLTTYVGDLEAGAQLAEQYMNDGFDIIISRGGTASCIRETATLPVVEIPLTAYDILRTLQLTSASTQSCAVIGFPSITIPAGRLCGLLHYDLEIVTIHNKEEAVHALDHLKKKGRHFVLCDVLTQTLAGQAGLHPVLITSGSESIQSAIEEAMRICSFSFSLMQKCSILEDALKKHPANTIILDATGKVYFSNYNAENISAVMDYLRQLMKEPSKLTAAKAFHSIDHMLYALTLKRTVYDNISLYLFYIEPNPVPTASSKYGLRYTSYENIVTLYSNSFYSLTSAAQSISGQIAQLTNASMPVMILGERGTGKNQAAARLYIDSARKNHPYITIDCPLINEKNWNYLTKHYNSPLFGKENTIFISNIQALSDMRCRQLLSLILDTNAHKRNRLIFSCSQTLDEPASDSSKHFISYLTCATIYLPPLRELTADIPSSANLYVNALNVELSKQISGFDPDALELLCHYDWPDNFEQLKRVLADLVLLTDTPCIQAATVQKVLEKEKRQFTSNAIDTFDYNRPLNTMLKEIVKVVLDKCDGNQSKAAKQLGIGRTTLWRYLNEEES